MLGLTNLNSDSTLIM